MTSYKRFAPNIFAGFWVIVMITMWLAFAPTQAGGMASYIIVIGNSMEPNFHIGDLVIVHEEAKYQIGDAVVYRNLELNSFVFHRIVEQEFGKFTLKGDNNSWLDTYQPSQDEVLGKLWLYIPKGGYAIQKIRNPIFMALIAGLLGGYLAISFFSGKSKGKKRMNKDWFASIKQKIQGLFSQINPADSSNSDQGNLLESSFFALGLVAFASIVFGIISFSRPATRVTSYDIRYNQLGVFGYSTSAPQGVYDANIVKSGDPIFPKLTCSVDVSFQYNLIAQEAENITGSYQLTATITEPQSGWQRTVALQEVAMFKGNTVGTNAKLDLCQMEKLTQSLEENTGFHPGSYFLSVSPNIQMDGTISGSELQADFNSALKFNYDRIHFYLIEEDEEQESLLSLTESGILSEARTEANTIRVFGMDLAVPALRLAAVIGLVISLSGLFLLGSRLQNLSTREPARFIHTKFNSQIINIQGAELIDSKTAVDVSSIDDLGKLAERFNTMILHAELNQVHVYYVQGEGTTYRFALDHPKAESAVPVQEANGQRGES